jgi:GT2 family glycosyltransferase
MNAGDSVPGDMVSQVAVIVVTWNSARFIMDCLASIPRTPNVRVIVVDNNSTDSTVRLIRAEFPSVGLIVNSRNTGYAHANNQGLKELGLGAREQGSTVTSCQPQATSHRPPTSDPCFVLLLNPDTILPSGGVERMVAHLEVHPETGVLAPRLADSDGNAQASVRRFPTWRNMLGALFGRGGDYRMKGFDYDEAQDVEQPMASCLLLRGEVLDRVGLFDEQFPMFFNDVDLLKRVRDAGWKVLFYPEVSVWHYVGGSTELRRTAMILSSHHSLFRYFRKHDRSGWFWLKSIPLALIVELAAFARIIVASIHPKR